MGISYVADRWAHSNTSRSMQYVGLGTYVVAEALLFVPLLYIANHFAPGAIASAGIVTAFVFSGLRAIVFLTKYDFSMLLVYFIGKRYSMDLGLTKECRYNMNFRRPVRL